MPSAAVNRKVIRGQLKTVFTAALTGVGKPFQAVYAEERRSFTKQSPVLLLLSAGLEPERWGIGTVKFHNLMRFAAIVFVAEAEPPGWTEANVEDTLDDCAKALMDVVMDNPASAGFWTNLWFQAQSSILPAVVGGEPYKMEPFTIIAEVYDA